jgi:NAD(P)-dependent dehydrogenase (short-subunit alcohol dehydrogenase family)
MSGETTLAGAVALVTGAGQPLADAIARRLGAAGARLALVHLPEDEDAARRLQSETGAPLVLACDPRDPEAVRGTVRAVASRCNGLDALVTAAVARVRGSARSLPFEEWARVIDIELSGSLYFSREAMRMMMRWHHGLIVHVADTFGLKRAVANNSAARGVAALMRALASEAAPHHIRVNAVSVSTMPHEFDGVDVAGGQSALRDTTFGRAAHPEEVAAAVHFLLSEDARFVNGHALPVNGGLYP